MKSLKILIVDLALLFAFQVSLVAQSKSVVPTKIALVSFEKFSNASAGIKDVIAIDEKLEQEFRAQELEIKILYVKHKNLSNELNRISESNGYLPIPEKLLNEKINDLDSAFCKLESKTKIVRLNYEERKAFLFSEVNKKIAELLKTFAKGKGYAVVLDNSQNNIIIEGETVDITNEFIQFYNSKTEKK